MWKDHPSATWTKFQKNEKIDNSKMLKNQKFNVKNPKISKQNKYSKEVYFLNNILFVLFFDFYSF